MRLEWMELVASRGRLAAALAPLPATITLTMVLRRGLRDRQTKVTRRTGHQSETSRTKALRRFCELSKLRLRHEQVINRKQADKQHRGRDTHGRHTARSLPATWCDDDGPRSHPGNRYVARLSGPDANLSTRHDFAVFTGNTWWHL